MPKLDNIDLDVIDADRLGYGPHYGHFKVDHPYTKDANEERLTGKKEKQKEKPTEKKIRIKTLHPKTCPVCAKQFTTTNKLKKYCCPQCKSKAGNTAWAQSRTK